MKAKGEFSMPIIWAIQCVNFFNWLAALLSSIPVQKFGAKKTMLIGQYGMVVLLFCIVLFNEIQFSMGIVLSMVCFLMTY